MSKRAAMVTDDGGGPFAALPPDLHHHLRPFFTDLTEEVVRAIRTEIPEYARPADDTYMQGVHRGVDHALRGFLERMAKPDSDRGPVQETYQRIGRGEAEEGRSLDSFQSALRLGARVTWRRVNALVDAELLPRNVLGAFGEALFLHLDEMAAATTAGYTEARLHAAGELQQRRMRLVDLLTADPPASPEAIADLAHSARWPVPKTLAVIAIDYGPPPPGPAGQAARPWPPAGGPEPRSSTSAGGPAAKPSAGGPTAHPLPSADGPVAPSLSSADGRAAHPSPSADGPAARPSPSTGGPATQFSSPGRGPGPQHAPPRRGPGTPSPPATRRPGLSSPPPTPDPSTQPSPPSRGPAGQPPPSTRGPGTPSPGVPRGPSTQLSSPSRGPLVPPSPPTRGPIVPPEFLARFDVQPAVLVVPDPEGPGRARAVAGALQGLRAAMGPTVSLQEGARSLRWASEALELVRRGVLPDAEMIRCQDHLATLLLLRDDTLVDAMAERRLRPLEQVRPPQRERLAETLLSWLSAGHNASEVAVRQAVHPQTVRYRMRQLDELFGAELQDPVAQFEMQLALRALQLRRGAGGSGAG
ncbi:helix-turn-helix domain-containing protein [Streptomyces sp. NPDC051913]|uniref:PucR family transcriptional regulator n=1 Tax=Streptomyces sp. NPDC051913 TaxID=3365676 RepID=UPI0037D28256